MIRLLVSPWIMRSSRACVHTEDPHRHDQNDGTPCAESGSLTQHLWLSSLVTLHCYTSGPTSIMMLSGVSEETVMMRSRLRNVSCQTLSRYRPGGTWCS